MSDTVDQSQPVSVETAPASVEPAPVKCEDSSDLLSRLFHAVYVDARGISCKIEQLLSEAKSYLGL